MQMHIQFAKNATSVFILYRSILSSEAVPMILQWMALESELAVPFVPVCDPKDSPQQPQFGWSGISSIRMKSLTIVSACGHTYRLWSNLISLNRRSSSMEHMQSMGPPSEITTQTMNPLPLYLCFSTEMDLKYLIYCFTKNQHMPLIALQYEYGLVCEEYRRPLQPGTGNVFSWKS